ncbi:hypothetical protein [Arthrobacter sp. RAF14]
MTTPSRDSSSHGGETEQGSLPHGLMHTVKGLGPDVSDDGLSDIATGM